MDYLHLGRLGQHVFFQTFPWIWLSLTIIGIAGGIFLLKKLDFSYKKNFMGIVVGIIGFLIIFGFSIDKIGLNRQFAKMPLMKGVYQQKMLGKNFVVGQISDINKNNSIIVISNEREIILILDKNTVLSGEKLTIDQYIKAVGVWQNDQFLVKRLKIVNHDLDNRIPNHKPHQELRYLNKK